MPTIKKRTKVRVNNTDSLERLMQETYNDATDQITIAQKTINELKNGFNAEDIDDAAKIAHETSTLLRAKNDGIKVKLELVKIQADLIKHQGDMREGVAEYTKGEATEFDFEKIRDMIKNPDGNVGTKEYNV